MPHDVSSHEQDRKDATHIANSLCRRHDVIARVFPCSPIAVLYPMAGTRENKGQGLAAAPREGIAGVKADEKGGAKQKYASVDVD